jgi:hypothetical protein
LGDLGVRRCEREFIPARPRTLRGPQRRRAAARTLHSVEANARATAIEEDDMDTTRESHQHQMESKMKEWGSRLDGLKAKADKATADAKVTLDKQVAEIGKLQDSARKHYEEFKASSKTTWSEVQHDVEARWTTLTSAVDAFWKALKN